MKPFWEMTDDGHQAPVLNATDWCRANYEYFRGGGFSSHFTLFTAEMPVTMLRVNVVDGVGPVLQLAEGWTGQSAAMRCTRTMDQPHRSHLAHAPGLCLDLTGEGAFSRCIQRHGQLGR